MKLMNVTQICTQENEQLSTVNVFPCFTSEAISKMLSEVKLIYFQKRCAITEKGNAITAAAVLLQQI